jgi:hypothetical protein
LCCFINRIEQGNESLLGNPLPPSRPSTGFIIMQYTESIEDERGLPN